MLGSIVNITLTVTAVSLIILVHEFGHFLGAKLVGMRVEVFSIGFWKRLAGFKKGHTDYRISLVPLGGYLKVAGESPEEGEGKPYEFWSKSPGQRAIFIVGGVLMNLVLAAVLFILAFWVGVPFTVAEVGSALPGEPAWKAGLRRGDRIVQIEDKEDPVFADITMRVVLGGEEQVRLRVRRDGRELEYTVRPEYDEEAGFRFMGIAPPIEPVVTDYAEVGGEGGRSPAREAGIKRGDRILAVNGHRIKTAEDLELQMLRYPNEEVEVLVKRGDEELTFEVLTEPVPRHMLGISAATTRIKSLQSGGIADEAGLKVGDVITEVNGKPIESIVALERAVEGNWGTVEFTVKRDDETLTIQRPIPDVVALEKFLESLLTESGTVLTWVEEGGPAWQAGLRPGDRITAVSGQEVEKWRDILRQSAQAEGKPHEVRWVRDGELLSQVVEPELSTQSAPGHLGVAMGRPVTEPRRYGPLGAVVNGVEHVGQRLAEIVLTLRGFATREVSPRHMGGIVTIARASYQAAEEGAGKLLYITAVISAAIGFFNLLPIPVLDGGHLLFVAIEKIRGRRLAEHVMTGAQTVGFVLLMALVIYVTWNDILRWIGPS
ncbi:MAG: RIP metalloprotease RseP [Candidatus Brocadiia bacterium]